MAIVKIEMEGFKSLTNHAFSFSPQQNLIQARNGIGKTSIADAICFVYCGTDRFGNARPLHLINKDTDNCKVSVTSDKGSQIVRTLTAKGNGTIKVIRDGIPNTLTQTQLSGLLGPQDVFLSASMLGYFMGLTPSKRKEVLNLVLPKPDPYAIVMEKTGQDIKGKYDLSKKSAAATIAQDRRGIDKQIDTINGELNALREQKLPEKPEVNPSVYQIKSDYESLAERWRVYEANKNQYEKDIAARNRALAQYQETDKKVKDWQKELETLTLLAEPETHDYTADIDALISKKKSLPARPALQAEIDAERCPTCSTPVSRKMMETVKAANAKAKEDFERETQEVTQFNKEIDQSVTELRSQANSQAMELKAIRDKNQSVRTRKTFLESSLANVTYPEIASEEPQPPVAPEGNLDEQAYKAACNAIREFDNATAVYESELSKMNRADQRIEELRNQQANLGKALESLGDVETVVKDLPNIILEMNKKYIDIEGLEVAFVDGDLAIKREGVPYTALSTGQKMRVDFALCQKINGFMERPTNLYFIDDADLIDELLQPETNAQVFYSMVDTTKEEIEVKSV